MLASSDVGLIHFRALKDLSDEQDVTGIGVCRGYGEESVS